MLGGNTFFYFIVEHHRPTNKRVPKNNMMLTFESNLRQKALRKRPRFGAHTRESNIRKSNIRPEVQYETCGIRLEGTHRIPCGLRIQTTKPPGPGRPVIRTWGNREAEVSTVSGKDST